MSAKRPGYRNRPARQPRPGQPRSSLLLMLLGAVAVLAVAATAAWSGWFSEGDATGAASTAGPPGASPIAVDRAAGVEVDMASIDLGSVPLNTAVEHKFKLRNTGEALATLGKVRIEVLEGC